MRFTTVQRVLYLPDFPADLTLSRWTGRPHGLAIDPLGVEAYVMETPKRSLFGRAKDPQATGYLHVLVHDELASDRIRDWCVTQVVQLGLLADDPELFGDQLNRRTADERELLADRDWTPARLFVDGQPVDASAFVVKPDRWAAYAEIGSDRVAVVARGITLDAAGLRTASNDEARHWRTEALRV